MFHSVIFIKNIYKMNLGIANQFVTKGLLLDRRSLDWGPGVVEATYW